MAAGKARTHNMWQVSKFLLTALALACACSASFIAAAAAATPALDAPAAACGDSPAAADDAALRDFLGAAEALVAATSDRALAVTRDVCRRLQRREMPADLLAAAGPLLRDYAEQVDAALAEDCAAACPSFDAKRRLLKHFRRISRELEELRGRIAPESDAFEFGLISEDFYTEGRNRTDFDNLYLWFMNDFERAAGQFRSRLSACGAEAQADLLELLDEIGGEHELRRKDKLYDELIEMFLFRRPMRGEGKDGDWEL